MLISISEFAKIAKTNTKTIQLHIEAGKFPFEVRGKKIEVDVDISKIPVKYTQEQVARFLDKQKRKEISRWRL